MTHIGKESRFQAVQFFGFVTGNDQLLFCLFQGSDIIVDTQHFNNSILRTIIPDHYVYTGPRIFSITSVDAYFFT